MLGFALFVDCTRESLALVLVTLFGVFYAGFMPGAFTAMISVAPAFTGTIASIASGISVLTKIIAPTIVGLFDNGVNNFIFILWSHLLYIYVTEKFDFRENLS